MKGKTVVATGATSGIGERAVESLARQGARIVFIARDARRAEATRTKLEAIAPGLGHRSLLADLSLMTDTKRVGAEIAASEPRIDVLINNAGAMFAERRATSEGLEMTFALNHMAYFVLTRTLLERLKGSAPARVVSTASAAHFRATLDFDDLQSAKNYSGFRVYGRSKLANILFHARTCAAARRDGRRRQLPAPRLRRLAVWRRGRRLARSADPVRQMVRDLPRAGRRHDRVLSRLGAWRPPISAANISPTARSPIVPPPRATTRRRLGSGRRRLRGAGGELDSGGAENTPKNERATCGGPVPISSVVDRALRHREPRIG